MWWCLVSLALCACASAGKGNSIIGGLDDAGPNDALEFPTLDAAVIDAPPAQVTLSQNLSETITNGNTFACRNTASGLTRANTYYRAFPLADHGVPGALRVTSVIIAVQLADTGPESAAQPGTVRLHTYGAALDGTTLDLAQLGTLATADVMIPDGAGTRLTVPITAEVAAGSILVVELSVPDGVAAGARFLIGSNAQGERSPGYTLAPTCNITAPRTMLSVAQEIRLSEAHIIMTVTGTQ
jgi:hypothetical protein